MPTRQAEPDRRWTFMVYLAGDNNLERYGLRDLLELKRWGSSDEIAFVAQFDRMSDAVTRRYYLTRRPRTALDVVQELPEVNTGDPQALIEFVTWATATYPARRYALVLWNHGSGWKDEDIYSIARRRGLDGTITRGQTRGLAGGKSGRSLFSTTLEKLVTDAAEQQRAILYDDSSADFLDSAELRQVLMQVSETLGRPLDLLGFDACLMSMVEVLYQLRGTCDVTVGSQEIEPGDGWPYDLVARHLLDQPNIEADALAAAIAEAYVHHYAHIRPNLPVTQSALRLDRLGPAVQAVDRLGSQLEARLAVRETQADTAGKIFAALRMAQTFTDRDYVDLIHFCELLAQSYIADELSQAAQGVIDALTGADAPLLAAHSHGQQVAQARGLSIYLPVREVSPLYARLDFGRDSHWDDFLQAFAHPH